MFDYDRRGILDATHVRFFTRRSFLHLATQAGFTVRRSDVTGLPLEVAERGAGEIDDAPAKPGLVQRIDRLATRARPQLFAYQFLFDLAPTPQRTDHFAAVAAGTPQFLSRTPAG